MELDFSLHVSCPVIVSSICLLVHGSRNASGLIKAEGRLRNRPQVFLESEASWQLGQGHALFPMKLEKDMGLCTILKMGN